MLEILPKWRFVPKVVISTNGCTSGWNLAMKMVEKGNIQPPLLMCSSPLSNQGLSWLLRDLKGPLLTCFLLEAPLLKGASSTISCDPSCYNRGRMNGLRPNAESGALGEKISLPWQHFRRSAGTNSGSNCAISHPCNAGCTVGCALNMQPAQQGRLIQVGALDSGRPSLSSSGI